MQPKTCQMKTADSSLRTTCGPVNDSALSALRHLSQLGVIGLAEGCHRSAVGSDGDTYHVLLARPEDASWAFGRLILLVEDCA